MSGWSFGGTFRALSTRLFGDDLAEELDPSMASSSPPVHPASVPPLKNDNLVQVRTLREHQPRPRPADLSAEQLQESMKELMRQPKLWTLYKEEMSMQEQPTHPETVRRVLIQFLECHEHEMTSKSSRRNSSRFRSKSIFQGWNADLEEESTHIPRNRPTPNFSKNMSESKGKSEDLETLMKRLMRHPELWPKFKELLSQEDSPDDPGTIRRLLVEFWKEHEQHILRWEKKIHDRPLTKEPRSREHHPSPPFVFKALNTDLLSESQHIQPLQSQSVKNHRRSRASASQRQSQVDTHRQLRLLRSSPPLYAKYQERLLMDESEENTPAADLLSKFLLEHKDELTALDEQAKRQEALEASLLNLETATMEEEKTESTVPLTRDSREKKLQPDRRQKFMAYRDTISSQSKRGIQEAIEALAGEAKTGTSQGTKQSIPAVSDIDLKQVQPSVLSQSEHPQLSRDRRQKFMAYKDTISSRSLRGIQEAMDSLSGEATMTRTGKVDSSESSISADSEGQTPSKRTSWRDSISEEGDLNSSTSSIGSLVAWGQAFSLSNVSKFVTHEMETLTSELDDCELLAKQELELMRNKGIYVSRGDNDSKENNFDDDDADLVLQQAAEIAIRHRRFHASNGGILESIPDENEEDGLDVHSVSADGGATSESPKGPTAPTHPEPSSVTLTIEPSDPLQDTEGEDSQVSSQERNGDSSQHNVADDDSLI